MPAPKRPIRMVTDEWEQLRLYVASPEQATYELLRPIVLFGHAPAARARETGIPERTLRRKADRFDVHGMASLFEQPATASTDRRALPPEIRQFILAVKAEYPPLRPHEITTICRTRFQRGVSHHTVQQVLTSSPLPSPVHRRFPRYRDIQDPVDRRLAVVRLYLEGWTITAIAGYLATKRDRVYRVLRRWFTEGLPGLEDQSRAPQEPARKVDLKALAAIRRLQANPELGGFRVSAALEQQGIFLSPRTCRRILALHRELGLPQRVSARAHESQPHPFTATRRHQIWSVDLRYIEDHGLDTDKPIYVLSVLDNYSRALLASLLSPRQDLTAYLVVLREAIARHGAPELLVSDSGSIFKAKAAQAIYQALGIEKRQIDAGQPWQNYIESHFGIMRRMADYHFAWATTWPALHAVHTRFFEDYNQQKHWAHQERPAGKQSPAQVLGWIHGAWCDPADLDRLFRLRAQRRVDAQGFVRYRHWRLYGERGLIGADAAVWLFGDTLTIEYATETLAQYQVATVPTSRHIRQISEPHLFATQHRSPQPFLDTLDVVEWHPVLRLVPYQPRRKMEGGSDRQLPLFDVVREA